MEQVCAEPEIGAGKRSGDPLSRRADGAEPGWETGKMSNSPHTLDFGNGTLLEKGVLRIWIGSRLTPSGKCRLELASWDPNLVRPRVLTIDPKQRRAWCFVFATKYYSGADARKTFWNRVSEFRIADNG